MKLSGRGKDGGAAAGSPETAAGDGVEPGSRADSGEAPGSHTTAPKGRPTPKRNATGRRRGPVAPAPMTSSQARARRKALAGPKLSRDERRAAKTQRRERMSETRARMRAGDEAYLPDRDRGPVRRYVRDLVGSRRNLLGLFMPSALALLFVMMAAPQVQLLVSPAMMILMVTMALDGVLLGRRVTKLVDAKFPDDVESRWKLGFYAVSRASQVRRMRVPQPQVRRGERVD